MNPLSLASLVNNLDAAVQAKAEEIAAKPVSTTRALALVNEQLVLSVMKPAEHYSFTQLREATGLSKSTIYTVITRLEKRNAIRRSSATGVLTYLLSAQEIAHG